MSALERFCYKGFLRNLSWTKFFVCPREVSTLEDVHLREVPLYIASYPVLLSHKSIRTTALLRELFAASCHIDIPNAFGVLAAYYN